jgi:hypothetical protein
VSTSQLLTARALILASGPTSPNASQIIDKALQDFIHEKGESQRIDLGGRTILAIEIKLDPAHAIAIGDELEVMGKRAGLDIAMEIL